MLKKSRKIKEKRRNIGILKPSQLKIKIVKEREIEKCVCGGGGRKSDKKLIEEMYKQRD